MKRMLVSLAACLLALLASASPGIAQQTGDETTPKYPRAELSEPFAPTLGDMIAQSLADLVTATKQSTDPATVITYDRNAKKIAVIISGSKTTLDGAKRAIDAARVRMHDSAEFIGALYHASLDEADFGYLYYHGGKNLINWEDGKYTVGTD